MRVCTDPATDVCFICAGKASVWLSPCTRPCMPRTPSIPRSGVWRVEWSAVEWTGLLWRADWAAHHLLDLYHHFNPKFNKFTLSQVSYGLLIPPPARSMDGWIRNGVGEIHVKMRGSKAGLLLTLPSLAP